MCCILSLFSVPASPASPKLVAYPEMRVLEGRCDVYLVHMCLSDRILILCIASSLQNRPTPEGRLNPGPEFGWHITVISGTRGHGIMNVCQCVCVWTRRDGADTLPHAPHRRGSTSAAEFRETRCSNFRMCVSVCGPGVSQVGWRRYSPTCSA